MAFVDPVVLESRHLRLLPLSLEHEAGLRAAASDGQLWTLRVTSVPEPDETLAYINTALQTDNRFAFAVTDSVSGEVMGSSSFHDIFQQSNASRLATPGMQRAISAPTSTPPASCC
jgi:hypothetical protein